MQDIREFYEDHGLSRELRDRLTGPESPSLDDQFRRRREAAVKRVEAAGGRLEIKESRRIGRNDPCPCGSSKKFKKCCGSRLAVDDERVTE